MSNALIHGIVFALYLLVMLSIGIYFYNKTESQSDYLLGGRKMNPWATALSAQASDMSGWLLMGLPGTAFLLIDAKTGYNNLAEAVWTAIGLGLGTYINWLILAKRLRKFTEVYSDSITIPSYLENRFHSKTSVLRIVSALFIILFFLIYTAAQFSAGAKLFQTVFGLDYRLALVIGLVVIVSYTFLGGYKAVCWTDLIQGILMFFAIVFVAIVAFADLGGTKELQNTLAKPDILGHASTIEDWFGFKGLGFLGIASALAWGLGYFGQPHIITRFMGIRSSKEIKPARRIAMLWVIITLTLAVVIGVIGKAYLSIKMAPDVFAAMDGEKIFIELVKVILDGPGLTIIAGAVLTAILAAIMSTADSQLLVTSSAVSEDIFKVLFKKDATDKQLGWISRITVIVVSIIAASLALDPNSSVFSLVSYAWAGFGAAFGPAILLSLYWKRMNNTGVIAGVISGGLTVLIWRNFIKPHFALYELLPAFIISVIFIVVFTLSTKAPQQKIVDEFDKALNSEV
ncbi:sodium:proline symporter [Clostridia bacterium]|nr:sodium:proline symporter [Clostridia bacterium]